VAFCTGIRIHTACTHARNHSPYFVYSQIPITPKHLLQKAPFPLAVVTFVVDYPARMCVTHYPATLYRITTTDSQADDVQLRCYTGTARDRFGYGYMVCVNRGLPFLICPEGVIPIEAACRLSYRAPRPLQVISKQFGHIFQAFCLHLPADTVSKILVCRRGKVAQNGQIYGAVLTHNNI